MNTFDSRYMQLKIDNLNKIRNKEKKVTDVAKEINVTRQTVHRWLNRYERYGEAGLVRTGRTKSTTRVHNRTSEEVEQLIINISKKYWQDGCETLHDRVLDEYNIDINPSTIYRILKRTDTRYTDNYIHTRKRWKKKLYAHTIPGYELQMDTKYPFGYKQGKVIYTIIDDCSRWVYAYTYSTANAVNTLDFLEKVRTHAPFPIQKIRTDNGKEFIVTKVRKYLHTHNITHRINTPYCPEENGKIERFHRTLNQKALRFSSMDVHKGIEELQYQLTLFLYYYNYQKRHRGLGMDGMTPVAKLQEKSVTLQLQCYKA